jgi:RNA polymerase sigma-70 factor (ECF subfamily)
VTDRSAASIARCIRRAREGQPEALEELLSTYRNYLRLLATTCLDHDVRAKADPSDVVQETLIKAHENFDQFRGTTRQEWLAWVRTILVNNLTDLHRRYSLAGRKVSRERSLELVIDRSSRILRNLLPTTDPSPSEQAQENERSVLLADALAELAPEDREVVILRNLQELDWNEIGLRTQRSPDAARMLWTRALRRVGALVKGRIR